MGTLKEAKLHPFIPCHLTRLVAALVFSGLLLVLRVLVRAFLSLHNL